MGKRHSWMSWMSWEGRLRARSTSVSCSAFCVWVLGTSGGGGRSNSRVLRKGSRVMTVCCVLGARLRYRVRLTFYVFIRSIRSIISSCSCNVSINTSISISLSLCLSISLWWVWVTGNLAVTQVT